MFDFASPYLIWPLTFIMVLIPIFWYLLHIIKEQNNKFDEQKKIIDSLNSKINNQSSAIDKLKSIINQQNNNLNKTIDDQKTEINNLNKTIDNQNSKFFSLNKTITLQETNINKQKENMKNLWISSLLQNNLNCQIITYSERKIKILENQYTKILNSYKILYYRKLSNIILNFLFTEYKKYFSKTGKIFCNDDKPKDKQIYFSIIGVKNKYKKINLVDKYLINLIIDFFNHIKDITSSVIHLSEKNYKTQIEILSIFIGKDIKDIDKIDDKYYINSQDLINILFDDTKQIKEEFIQKNGGVNEINNKDKGLNVNGKEMDGKEELQIKTNEDNKEKCKKDDISKNEEKNIISINNENSNNSSNLKIFEENKYENNKKEDNNLNIEEIGENFEEENNNISKGIEYETVNNNYSIKKCSTVIEYSFREDQNISYCPIMEDKSKSIENFNNNKNQILFELFDGFKGDEISNFLQQNFTHIYKQYLEETNGNIPRSLVKSFREIDEIIKKMPNSKGKSSTGTVVHIIWENKKKLMVYSGNVGNSKICLVSPEYIIKLNQEQATPESKFINAKLMRKKHNKNNILKRKYEESNEEGKKYKVFGNYKLNEIQEQEQEKERKFGYYKFNRFNYKKNKKENNKDEESDDKLILIPYIAKMEIDLTIKNQYLFLASNGIWNKIDENEMKELTDNTKDTEQLCSNIVKNALYRDTKDNISIFSIKLT